MPADSPILRTEPEEMPFTEMQILVGAAAIVTATCTTLTCRDKSPGATTSHYLDDEKLAQGAINRDSRGRGSWRLQRVGSGSEGARPLRLLALSEGQRVGAPTLRRPPAAALLAQRGPSECRRLGGLLAQGRTLRLADPSSKA